MRAALLSALIIVASSGVLAQRRDPDPKTLEEFRAAVQQVLSDTGTPGAGIALVRTDGVEWAGGIGVANRETQKPVTADTHFRAGSISKTFVAAALVQMYLDSEIELDERVSVLAPGIPIDNAWDITDPVRLIHVLQHTAGFDDAHFNEVFNFSDPADMPLESVLRRNPASLVVRWRPGTRMSYSNSGYTVAAHIIERVTGQRYEDRIAERIFKPTDMPTSSFRLTREDEALLATGYGGDRNEALPYTQIYHRPSGNLHTSARELGNFVHMLLNWGETPTDLVIDPEYLSNMEHPRTTLASAAGLRNGYGTGIASFVVEGFPMLGHNGGIEGFASEYGYSTSRDVGYVILLNSRASGDARRRIASLAVRYLKSGVEPPEKPVADVADATLRSYEGYYHDASPRSQGYAFLTWLLGGQSIRADGQRLVSTTAFGSSTPLIPVSDTLFRLESEPEPSRVFIAGDGGQMILTGGYLYAERRPRWRIDSVRWAVLISSAIVVTPLLMLIPWTIHSLSRRRRPGERAHHKGVWVKLFLVLCAVAFLLPVVGIAGVADRDIGTRNAWTATIFAGTVLMPIAAILSFLFTLDAWRVGAGRWLRGYALLVSIAALIISGYLSAWGMIGFKSWTF
ncbi:MAG TPA: serine hydrolase domain-containing protein [Vicinamibacterales bacterium]|nr:serine hydrolase domain-containing protein [Vicinamibacterales bacterium]